MSVVSLARPECPTPKAVAEEVRAMAERIIAKGILAAMVVYEMNDKDRTQGLETVPSMICVRDGLLKGALIACEPEAPDE